MWLDNEAPETLEDWADGLSLTLDKRHQKLSTHCVKASDWSNGDGVQELSLLSECGQVSSYQEVISSKEAVWLDADMPSSLPNQVGANDRPEARALQDALSAGGYRLEGIMGCNNTTNMWRASVVHSKEPVLVKVTSSHGCTEHLLHLSHPNIVHSLACLPIPYESANLVALVMEAAACSLDAYLCRFCPARVHETWARKWFQESFAAVEYLHMRGWAHCQITLEHILLSASYQAKICGLSHLTRYSSPPTTGFQPGKSSGARCNVIDHQADLFKVDVLALGKVLYTLVNGCSPATSLKHGAHVSVALRQLLQHMLLTNPTLRCSLNGIKYSPWMMETPCMISSVLRPLSIVSVGSCSGSTASHTADETDDAWSIEASDPPSVSSPPSSYHFCTAFEELKK